MYAQFRSFQEICGDIFNFKVIHLLRAPAQAAHSRAQMEADREFWGTRFKAHRAFYEPPQQHLPISRDRVQALSAKIERDQEHFRNLLINHPSIITISYEELTNNLQIDRLCKTTALHLLNFLGLEYSPLKTKLKKTAPPNYDYVL
jgi:hypothetical protein